MSVTTFKLKAQFSGGEYETWQSFH